MHFIQSKNNTTIATSRAIQEKKRGKKNTFRLHDGCDQRKRPLSTLMQPLSNVNVICIALNPIKHNVEELIYLKNQNMTAKDKSASQTNT